MPEPAEFPVLESLQSEELLDCVHCGLCLSVCPTYDLLGAEGDSPRGRIYLIRALAEGRTDVNPRLVEHLDRCLGCRACETVCPSGVHYGEFLMKARDEIERRHRRPWRQRAALRALLGLITRPDALAPALFGAKLATGLFGQRGGPVAAVNRWLFGPKAPEMPIPERASLAVERLPEVTAARGERRARVLVLPGCVMQVLFQRVNRATIRVLAENGCEVRAPAALGCCGAFHMHNGFLDEARVRARALLHAVEALEASEGPFDALVVNSAGCGSSMKEYPELFRGDAEWEPRARALAARTRDASEFLAALGLRPPTRRWARRVAYHDACHLAHAQQIRAEPRALLRRIPGLQLVEFLEPDTCCGSAGIYNFLQPELAERLQERKVGHLLAAEPEVVVTGNPGCHAWIEAGLRRRGRSIPVLHTMEVLAEAYGEETSGAAGG